MHHDRVQVEPQKPKKGDRVEVKYKGLLKDCGASQVYCHCGYDGWQKTQTIPMNKVEDGTFTCQIPAERKKEINLCFKDSADNWDDNSGWNWNCEISGRGLLF